MHVDENSLKRAIKCIEHYDLETIGKTEEAFLRAISRNQERCNLPYFFGILRNIQADMDTARYERYCRDRYNYRQMKDRERQLYEIEQDRTTVEVMVDTLVAAISSPLIQVKVAAINQARRMTLELKEQYCYVAPLKKKILTVFNEKGDLSLLQRDTIGVLVDQCLT